MRLTHSILLVSLFAGLAVLPARAAVDEDDKRWLAGVQPILLDDEAQLYESIASKDDRLEFRKIFWARRDPDLGTTENEFQLDYEKRKPVADKRFFVGTALPVAKSTDPLGARPSAPSGFGSNKPLAAQIQETELRQFRDQLERPSMDGSLTDCGLTFLVLGEPDDIQKRPLTIWGDREPQVWSYRSRETRILFDEACMMPVGNDKVRRQLKEYAITQPTIAYHIRGGELLKKLADMLPRPSPATALMREGRQDFALATRPFFRKAPRGTGVFGLVRGDGASLFRETAAGGRARLLVRAELLRDEGGGLADERETLAEVGADGAFLASYRVDAPPGHYTLKVAVVDANSNRGSVLAQPLDVPDFGTGSLTLGSLFALEGLEEGVKQDPKHPLSVFVVGDLRFRPRFDNVFHPSDELSVSYQFYDPQTDTATHKPAARARLRILQVGGTPIAEAPEEAYDSAVAGTVVGPVSLKKYPPGVYVIELRVVDTVAQKAYTQKTMFEVRPTEKEGDDTRATARELEPNAPSP
jgi:hypothetical protein